MAKLGEGHAAAMARLGLQELRNAANPSRESVAGMEVGLYGTATQGEIAEARREEPLTLSQLHAEAEQQTQEHGMGHDRDRGMER